MGFITNQWLKNNSQGRGHFPINVHVESYASQRKWEKNHKVAVSLSFEKTSETCYVCPKCGITTSEYGLSLPICSYCKKQLTPKDKSHVNSYDEYQQAYLTQNDISGIIKDLFIANSMESNRNFLREVIPNISDEFKLEMIKILLKDK